MIDFKAIPQGLKTPGVRIEEAASNAIGSLVGNLRAMIISQTINTQPVAPKLITSTAQARTLYGRGSILALMIEDFFSINQSTELWALPVADAAASIAAEWTITVSAASPGTATLSIADKTLAIGLAGTVTPSSAATSIAQAINADPDLPVTATSLAGVVTVVAKNKGKTLNELVIKLATDSSATAIVAQSVTGATDPVLENIVPVIGDFNAYYMITSLYDSVDWLAQFADSRRVPGSKLRSVIFDAEKGDASTLVGNYASKNSKLKFTLANEPDSVDAKFKRAIGFAARSALSLAADPARQLRGQKLDNFTPIAEGDLFTRQEREILLNNKLSTYIQGADGVCRLERVVSNNTLNDVNAEDDTYLDVMTRTSVDFISMAVENLFETRLYDKKLARDGIALPAGDSIVTPKIIKEMLLEQYEFFVEIGMCQSVESWKKNVIVEINAIDPNRVDIYYPAYLINNLMVVAIKLSPSLKA